MKTSLVVEKLMGWNGMEWEVCCHGFRHQTSQFLSVIAVSLTFL